MVPGCVVALKKRGVPGQQARNVKPQTLCGSSTFLHWWHVYPQVKVMTCFGAAKWLNIYRKKRVQMAVLQEDARQPTNMSTSGCNTMCVVFQWFVLRQLYFPWGLIKGGFVWQVQTVCMTTQNKTLNKLLLLTPILLNLYHGQMNFVGNTARSFQDNGFALKTNKTACTIHNAFGSRSETPTLALLFWQSGCMCILRCWGEMNNQTTIGQGCFHTVGTTVGARTRMVKKNTGWNQFHNDNLFGKRCHVMMSSRHGCTFEAAVCVCVWVYHQCVNWLKF